MEEELDDFVLRPLTKRRLDEVAETWSNIGGRDEFEVELGHVFEWSRLHLHSAFELYNETQSKTDAILEVVQGERGRATKLMRIYLSPEFWPVDAVTPAVMRTHIEAYATFIFSGLSSDTRQVKIYGRTDVSLNMLTSMQRLWPNFNTGSTAKMEGRWLAITRK